MRSLRPPRTTLLALRGAPKPAQLSTFSHPPQTQPRLHAQPRAQLQPRPHPHPNPQPSQSTRPLSFLASLLPPTGSPQTQTLHTHRLLPHPPSTLHTLISDIGAYSLFLPHCTTSTVTRWTTPPAAFAAWQPGQGLPPRLPAQADLTVGYGPITQSYTSLVYAIPASGPGGGGIVEAVSGAARTGIDEGTLREWGYPVPPPEGVVGAGEGIFESLVTRWTVKPAEGREGWSDVELTIRYRFANAALGGVVGSLAGGMVEEMVGAFEGRAGRMLKGMGSRRG